MKYHAAEGDHSGGSDNCAMQTGTRIWSAGSNGRGFEYIETYGGSLTFFAGADCAGSLIIEPNQPAASSQRIDVAAGQTKTIGPFTGRVLVRVECSQGFLTRVA